MSEHTSTNTDTGQRRGRRAPDLAFELIKRLRAENPKADAAARHKLYVKQVLAIIEAGDDQEAINGVIVRPIRDWLAAHDAEPREPRARVSAEKSKAQQAAYKAEIAAGVDKHVEEIVTRRLLEYEIMDGRVLGDLSGADCRNLSERYGMFFHVISDTIPARAKVRNHFTDLELQAIALHHKLIVP